MISSGVKAVEGAHVFSMVLKQDGSVWATGNNDHGQHGDGHNGNNRRSFVKVTSINGT